MQRISKKISDKLSGILKAQNLWTVELVKVGRQVQRYIHPTELSPRLQQMIDTIDSEQAMLSLFQVQRLKKQPDG